MHIKRSLIPKTWPIARKSRKMRYTAVPSHAASKGITLLYILRDILKIAKTRKEVQKILFYGEVKVNNIIRKEDAFPVQVLDTISLEKSKKYYRLQIVNKKFKLIEISEKAVEEKIVKIIGKKVLPQEKVQMNLEDGSNLLVKDKFSVGDSVILNLKQKKIVKILPLKKGAKMEVILGKHAGKKGELIDFEKLVRGKDYKVQLEDGTKVNLPYKTVLVIG